MKALIYSLFAVAALFVKRTVNTVKSLLENSILNSQTGSFQITEAFVEGFKNNIYMLAQQKEARLFGKSRMESQNSKVDFYERIGVAEGQEVTERHGDTPINNTPHSRRAVTLSDYDYGDLIDKFDRVRLLIEPQNAYVQAAVMYLNRVKDDIFISAALGNARSGEDGETLVSLPDTQRIVALDAVGSSATLTNLNVDTLRRVNKKFDDADIEDDAMRMFAFTGSQKQSLLSETEVTSSDFASVKALVMGQVDTFLGFKFVRSERLPVTADAEDYDETTGELDDGSGGQSISAGARRCFAWIEDGMLSSVGINLDAQVYPRPDKKMSTQIYVCQSIGAVRMEEEKIVEVLCTES